MEKDFDRWNEEKKRLANEVASPLAFPNDGEVWVCTMGKNLGHEQNGGPKDFSRPALVIRKFNNEMFWIVPLTSKQKLFDFYFNYTDPSGIPVAAILAQLRLVSINRFRRILIYCQRLNLIESELDCADLSLKIGNPLLGGFPRSFHLKEALCR